jgi:hypothetical protein
MEHFMDSLGTLKTNYSDFERSPEIAADFIERVRLNQQKLTADLRPRYVKYHIYFDQLEFLRQLGLTPGQVSSRERAAACPMTREVSIENVLSLTQESNAMENNGKPTGDHSNGVVVVRPATEIMSRQQLPYYVGISEATAGAKNISMNLIIIPPAGAAEPHLHKGYESAIILA